MLISASSLTFNMRVNDMVITRDSSWTDKFMERNQTDQPKYTHMCSFYYMYEGILLTGFATKIWYLL